MKKLIMIARVLAPTLFVLALGIVQAQALQLVSGATSAQTPVSGGGDSFNPVVSRDGRYILFSSSAGNLVSNSNGAAFPADYPGVQNVFRRDRTTGTTTLMSFNVDGTGAGNGDSLPVAISTNGQYVLFESSASNLVAGDSNNVSDVFVRDLVNNTTVLVSVSTNGGVANGTSRSSTMTSDGRYVAFVSAANNLVLGDTNGIPDVFVHDLQAGTTVLASVGAKNFSGSSSESPDISGDGRYVVFFSTATNLINGVATSGEIYVRDLVSGISSLASVSSHDISQLVYGTTNCVSYNHTISDDGQYVAFEISSNSAPSYTLRSGVILRYNVLTGITETVNTNALGSKWGFEADYRSLDMTPDGRFITFLTNIVVASQKNAVCVWDSLSNTTTIASLDFSGLIPTNFGCYWPQISDDGRLVSFFSNATNLTATSVLSDYHLYVRDMQSNVTTLIDSRLDGATSSYTASQISSSSGDGRVIAFQSYEPGLITNDANRCFDIFVRDLAVNSMELISGRLSNLPSLSPNGPSALVDLAVSSNAQYVVFSTEADILITNDFNSSRDVFVHDMLTGTNTLVSAGTNGVDPGNNLSFEPAISADGRYVAFTSSSSDLVSGDTNNTQDVFIRDVQSGTTSLVSVNMAGTGPGNAPSFSSIISADGRYVLFHSKASDLAPGITSTTYENLFWRDLQSSNTIVFLTNTVGGPLVATMTANGRYVGYGGSAGSGFGVTTYVWDLLSPPHRIYTNTAFANGVALNPNGTRLAYAGVSPSQVYVVDLVTRTNLLLGTSAIVGRSGLQYSADGRFLVYSTGGSLKTNQVNLLDFQTGTNFVVSKSFNSASDGNSHSDSPTISSDGRYVAYRSFASNIVPGDSNGVPDIFLYDRVSGDTTLMSVGGSGFTTANNRSMTPLFSGDSQTFLFESWASDLIQGDFNQSGDLFAFSLAASNSELPLVVTIIAPATLTWPVVSGKTYQVQFKNTLADPFWQVVNGSVTIVGNQGSISDLAPASGHRFYRVVSY